MGQLDPLVISTPQVEDRSKMHNGGILIHLQSTYFTLDNNRDVTKQPHTETRHFKTP